MFFPKRVQDNVIIEVEPEETLFFGEITIPAHICLLGRGYFVQGRFLISLLSYRVNNEPSIDICFDIFDVYDMRIGIPILPESSSTADWSGSVKAEIPLGKVKLTAEVKKDKMKSLIVTAGSGFECEGYILANYKEGVPDNVTIPVVQL